MDMNSTSGRGEQTHGCRQRKVLALSLIRRRTLWSVAAAAFLLTLSPPSLWAQGPLQRLGERIRARASLGLDPRAGRPIIPGTPLQPRRPIYPLQPLAPYGPLPDAAAPLEPRVRVDRPPLPPVVTSPGTVSPGGAGVMQAGAPGYRNPASGTGSANYNRARPYSAGASLPATGQGQFRQQQAVAAVPNYDPTAEIPAAETVAPAASEPTPPPRARLGAVVDTPPDLIIEGQPPRRRRGAWVTEVLPQSPAEVAGLRVGDLIVAVQGRVITSVRDLIDVLSQSAEGDALRIDYARNDSLGAATVTLAGPDGLARQLPGRQGDPAATPGEDRSLLGGIGSIFGGLLGGQPPAGSPAPQPAPAPQQQRQADSGPQPPPPPQPPPIQPFTPLQPFEGSLETLPAPLPEQP